MPASPKLTIRKLARYIAAARLLGLTAALLALFYGEALFGGQVYYAGDAARQYIPQHAALKRALARGSLPWWAPELGGGYPLLAEGETGALYPLNWALDSWLSPATALTVSIVLHYLIAAAGAYLCSRKTGRSRAAACCASIVLALGGFYAAHQSHSSVLAAAAWLPWLLLFTHGLLRPPSIRGRAAWQSAGLALVTALQFLAGHAQIALLGMIVAGLYALALGFDSERRWRGWAWWLGGILAGTALAAPQIIPSLELTTLSQRAGGLDNAFFTSYSFHPLLLATYVSPFLRGNPYPQGSVELMGYVGLLPLALAAIALWRRREAAIWFFATLGLVGVFLAFGKWNPLYDYIQRIPLLNLFRVPARYLYWTSLALAMLSAHGFDALRAAPRHPFSPRAARWFWGAGAALGLALTAGGALGARAPDANTLVSYWRWLPALLAGATFWVVAAARRISPRWWTIAALSLLIADLYAYGAVLDRTYNAAMPRQEAERQPLALDFLAQDHGLYRIYTKEEILPALWVMREAMYPNIALQHGLSSANLYMPLIPRAYQEYMANLTPQRLNLLNVKYYLIPQLLPVDEASELSDVQNPWSALPPRRWLEIEPTEVASLEIESYLSHAADLPDGALAAELWLRDVEGREIAIPLRAGIETAEWAYEREDVAATIAHSLPAIATTWPARSGFPAGEHAGHTYRAQIALPGPIRLRAVLLQPALSEAFARVERVRLYDAAGEERLLSHLLGLGDHTIVYRSEDVMIYRNEDALPRAFTLPAGIVGQTDEGLALPAELRADEVGAAQIDSYEPMRVVIRATVNEPSYLILADLYYPGWQATVDGASAPILCAGSFLRAVALAPGEHEIVFRYR